MKIAVVDGYSTGRTLVSALRNRGSACIHVQSSPDMSDYFTRGFHADDYEAVLGAGEPTELAAELSRLGVQRVVAGTESGVILADTLTHLMGLPGNRYDTIAARRDKVLMGDTAAAAGVATPLGGAFADAAEAAEWFASHGLEEGVVKPTSSAGTDNVRFCRTPADIHSACDAVLNSANLYGQPNTVALVQERVRGVEYYANTVSHEGVHRMAELWRYTKRVGSSGYPIYDYEEPVPVASAEAAPLREFVAATLDALGVVSGAAHTEVMMTARGPVLIESGARLGGGTAPAVVEKFSGTSQTSLFADTLIDPKRLEEFDDAATTWSRTVRNVALINPVAGKVSSLDWTERIEALPTLVTLTHGVTAGEQLAATTDLINSPGYVYLAAEDPQDIERDYRALRDMEEEGLYTGRVRTGSAARHA
ncbi:ATP-grasp domain-containing protein [Streptomyces sp. NPDC050161]|uniref:ATP-grasp domain-containing protein n=1 Tax=Streptomyces sp. NPDC050161 TaxID=3365604 RepID=UPI00378775AE